MPILANGYTIRDHMFTSEQVEAAYAKLQKMGFDGVESPAGMGFMSSDEQLSLLKKYNLKVCDLQADLEKPEEAMAMAEKFGVKIFSLEYMPGAMMKSVDGFRAFAAKINRLAQPFKESGFRLQYHNHAQEFRNFPELNGKPGLEILIEETDPEAVCIQIDTYWAAAAGADPARWIRRVSGRIPVVHFKDYAIDSKANDTGLGSVTPRFAEIGQGNIDWKAVTQACREAGVKWYSVEQDQTVLNAFDCLKMSLDHMKGLDIH